MTLPQITVRLMTLLAFVASGLYSSSTTAFEEETATNKAASTQTLNLIIMDPLAAPLSCPCVKGYAQRKYEKLGEFLEQQLGRKVEVKFSESLAKVLPDDANKEAFLIIGKESVVRADASVAKLPVKPVARLSDLKGETTQTGLIVVPANDPAKNAGDLEGYRIFFGPSECAEKHQAAMKVLKQAHVTIPEKLEISAACSDGACKILEFDDNVRGAAVISSYAQPLLQGCGTIKKGDLRVIAETKPVPFITAFVGGKLETGEKKAVSAALMNVVTEPELCKSLESLLGFVPFEEPENTNSPVTAALKKK